MENNEWKANPQETRGWEIVKILNDSNGSNGSFGSNGSAMDSLTARKLLAEYVGLGTKKPSRLHSAILSCAVKMAQVFPEFHFVPFLNIWGFQNLRSEDSEARIGDDDKRFPSLVERMTKAYAYSLLFHPQEHLEVEFEQMLKPHLEKKGFLLQTDTERMTPVTSAIATRVITTDVKGRKMTFVGLLTASGEELMTEVHTITAHNRMRYDDIQGKMFDVLLRKTESEKLKAEAAILSEDNIEDKFVTKTGYVEHIDTSHHHIHIYDNESRHFVANYIVTNIREGQYLKFVPIIPKESKFKSAIIARVMEEKKGREAFGMRDAVVTSCNQEQGYCSWELLPDASGNVTPITETGAGPDVEPATKGYLSKQVIEACGGMPAKGQKIRILTFLKRGKDRKKRPLVVWYEAI